MKKWYTSKTIWIGVLEALAGGILTYQDYVQSALDGEQLGVILLISGLAKVVLRAVTTAPVGK